MLPKGLGLPKGLPIGLGDGLPKGLPIGLDDGLPKGLPIGLGDGLLKGLPIGLGVFIGPCGPNGLGEAPEVGWPKGELAPGNVILSPLPELSIPGITVGGFFLNSLCALKSSNADIVIPAL